MQYVGNFARTVRTAVQFMGVGSAALLVAGCGAAATQPIIKAETSCEAQHYTLSANESGFYREIPEGAEMFRVSYLGNKKLKITAPDEEKIADIDGTPFFIKITKDFHGKDDKSKTYRYEYLVFVYTVTDDHAGISVQKVC